MEKKTRTIANDVKLVALAVLLGGAVGAVVWIFLKMVGVCTHLIWDVIPDASGISFISVILCTAGGLAAGLIRRRCGDYPEELPVVLGKIKMQKHYEYDHMLVLLVCAFIPLVFGASVGPEAGLTGIIAGLCYWIGDNLKYAKEHVTEYSEIGAAVTLGSLFHVPLFGIFAVEESEMGSEDETVQGVIPKGMKILLYGLSAGAALLAMKGLSSIFGPAGEGFPSFEFIDTTTKDYLMAVVYIPVGILLFVVFHYSELICGKAAEKIPAVVRETICGLCIGLIALIMPGVLFSGEGPMGELSENFGTYAPAALIGICLLKLFLTAFCIKLGLKGGHFFPVIYACSCMGFAIAMLVFPTDTLGHAIFAAALITAAALGAQMRKPVATAMLLLICFPLRLVIWLLIGAAAAGRLSMIIFRKDKG